LVLMRAAAEVVDVLDRYGDVLVDVLGRWRRRWSAAARRAHAVLDWWWRRCSAAAARVVRIVGRAGRRAAERLLFALLLPLLRLGLGLG